jgi:hypothetical protein
VPYSLQQLSDIQSIKDAAHRYCRGVDRLDADEMRLAYWPDAVDDHGVFVGNAWEFVDRVVGSHGRWKATMHCILNHHIQLHPDDRRAAGEIYNVTYLFHPDGSTMDTWWGRYLDTYECRSTEHSDREWRIVHRVCVHESTRSYADGIPMGIAADRFRQGSFDRNG